MPIREHAMAARPVWDHLKPRRRSRLRRPTRWRPHLEALEQHILLSGADLVISSAVAPTILSPGETTRVSWSAANRGSVATDASWSDSVYLSADAALDGGDTLLGSPLSAPTTLAPGASYTRDTSFSVPTTEPGSYYLLFVADAGGDQAEADEANNVRAVPVTVTGTSSKLPDLVVTDATAPSSAQVGSIAVSWTLKNQGNAAAPGGWSDAFYLSTDATYDSLDTNITSYYQFNSLAAGASQSFNTTLSLPGVPAGSYYLLVVADGYHSVTESDENNNVKAVPITLTVPNVDLVVTAADAPATAKSGATADLSWTIKNQGTDPATAIWYDNVYLSTDATYDQFFDTYVSSQYAGDVAPLAAGTVTRAALRSRSPRRPPARITCCSSLMVLITRPRPTRTTTSKRSRSRSLPSTSTWRSPMPRHPRRRSPGPRPSRGR